jgi:hypothetical protein
VKAKDDTQFAFIMQILMPRAFHCFVASADSMCVSDHTLRAKYINERIRLESAKTRLKVKWEESNEAFHVHWSTGTTRVV